MWQLIDFSLTTVTYQHEIVRDLSVTLPSCLTREQRTAQFSQAMRKHRRREKRAARDLSRQLEAASLDVFSLDGPTLQEWLDTCEDCSSDCSCSLCDEHGVIVCLCHHDRPRLRDSVHGHCISFPPHDHASLHTQHIMNMHDKELSATQAASIIGGTPAPCLCDTDYECMMHAFD